MNREMLRDRINSMPLFEKRPVKVKKHDSEEYTTTTQKAICEVDGNIPYAFVSDRYHLLQFRDIFSQILDSVEGDLDGAIHHHGGYARLQIFPKDEQLTEGKSRFGLVAINSVDMSSSVIVNFCVETDGYYITIPPKLAGIKNKHSKGVRSVAKDYISMIGKVKDSWRKIIDEFPKYVVVKDLSQTSNENAIELKTVIKQLQLGSRLGKEIEEQYAATQKNGYEYTLWDAFIRILEIISRKKYKSDVHRQRRIDAISKAVFNYSLVLSL